jgi:hypothetical protein
MDGDYTYDPADIERFLQHAKLYEQIVGLRQSKNIGKLHQLGNQLICLVFNILFHTSVSDVCSGMYLMSTNAAKELYLRTRGFSVEAEVLAQMSMNGRVTEVPISYRNRIGKPKLVTWEHGIDIMKSVLLLARIYNPVFLFSLVAACSLMPGLGIMLYVLWVWLSGGAFYTAWALIGMLLLVLGSHAFIIGTIAILLKRSEIRIERLVRMKGSDGEFIEPLNWNGND